MLYETKVRFETQTNVKEVKKIFGLPDFSFQQIEIDNNEKTVHVTLLEDDHKVDFIDKIKNGAKKKGGN